MLLLKRLIRRIKWLLLYQWKTLSTKSWPYETCRRCGKAYSICWSVRNNVWDLVIGKDKEGCYCMECFLEIAETKEIKVVKEDFDTLEVFIGREK